MSSKLSVRRQKSTAGKNCSRRWDATDYTDYTVATADDNEKRGPPADISNTGVWVAAAANNCYSSSVP